MGYRIIADKAGLEVEEINQGLLKMNDPRWGGYLANVSPEEYERNFESVVPTSITGEEFLKRYGGTTDVVSKIDPTFLYQVKAPTEHAIYESSRVRRFVEILDREMKEEDMESLGELMFASHDSYSACGLTEPRTDRIVELVREHRSLCLFGSRITGGGSGGTVVVLAKRNSEPAISKILDKIEQEAGKRPYFFKGSSPGAAAFGLLRLSSTGAATSPAY
jgi:L-arabinokinase